MSILIRGMEMPKTCNDCGLRDSFDCWITDSYIEARFSKRNDNCPLIELPPHGRLADLDQMIEDYWDGNHMEIDEGDLKAISQYKVVIEAEGSET